MSKTLDAVEWHEDTICNGCGSGFVYTAPDVTLDVRYLELIATCPECGGRVVVDAPVRRRRELIATHFTPRDVIQVHVAPVKAPPPPAVKASAKGGRK